MRELNQPITDTEDSISAVFIDDGKPKIKAMSILELAELKTAPNRELAGVFFDNTIAVQLHRDLERGDILFIPQ